MDNKNVSEIRDTKLCKNIKEHNKTCDSCPALVRKSEGNCCIFKYTRIKTYKDFEWNSAYDVNKKDGKNEIRRSD